MAGFFVPKSEAYKQKRTHISVGPLKNELATRLRSGDYTIYQTSNPEWVLVLKFSWQS